MSRTRLAAAGIAGLLACTTLAACNSGEAPRGDSPGLPQSGGGQQTAPATPRVRITSNAVGRNVPVDRLVHLSAHHGTLEQVTVTSPQGRLPGKIGADGTSWSAGSRLEPGLSYRVHAVATREDGTRVVRDSRFRATPLTLDEQTYASIAPLSGETVGVGMPVIVTFDVPVTDKASMEKHMHVTASPAQQGSWHWISDQEVHWRPRTYWKANSTVDVNLDINSVPAGNGVYGQESRSVEFHTGDAHIYRVNTVTDQMKVFSNGQLLRTIPITTGEQPKYTTRSGVKVIIEKFRKKRMNSETVGIDPNGPDGYDIKGVEYAMRVTYSGEFVHAAPWSVADQGHANVSHGCTGMSTANAGWLYNMSIRGDVVEYTGTDKPMTLTNGYGDWNESFPTYSQGSALS